MLLAHLNQLLYCRFRNHFGVQEVRSRLDHNWLRISSLSVQQGNIAFVLFLHVNAGPFSLLQKNGFDLGLLLRLLNAAIRNIYALLLAQLNQLLYCRFLHNFCVQKIRFRQNLI